MGFKWNICFPYICIMSIRLTGGTWLVWIFLFVSASANAQSERCGIKQLNDAILAVNPTFQEVLDKQYEGMAARKGGQLRTTGGNPVPVVFHIVLNQAQLNQIGGAAGVKQRIDSEIVVLNRDFNARNADSLQIPAAFKPLYGNAGISFALAHTTPKGDSTEGYEIRVISKTGTNVSYGYGSGFGFSGAKYTAADGLDGWDPTSYLNVWVLSPQDQGNSTNIIGLAIPHYYTEGSNPIPSIEQGVVLHYGAFGVKSLSTQYYLSSSTKGRTLTHEAGHMFYLLHPWGDDDGECPGVNGGKDDGIADTPPEASSASGCPAYPKFDKCSKTGAGIMFMNYMDYVNDDCMHLFSHGQVEKMQSTVSQDGPMFSLTQHPQLLDYPKANTDDNVFTIVPNPATGFVNIVFNHTSKGLNGISMTDGLGRVVATKELTEQTAFYSFDLTTAASGIYFLRLHFASGLVVKKVMVQ